ncbi:GNAT family N-acetyltransferase [Pseudomonas sp. dw_358]|uniref:GNAT family N-acetyltransferase n=1 Tax=Pseudomonas sp. dw_358 TaxID=2720083 RepID=UPI001BD44461|nr:GNAT family N-acetyltransferase [Pseudomonas sp. dw_358]
MRDELEVFTPHPSEYPELAQLWEKSVRATHHFLPDSYIRLLRPLVENHYLNAVMLICCRDRRGYMTGFAGIAMGKVEMLFIHPRHRGHGIGTRLLQYAVLHLNASELEVNEQNPKALGFYRKQGFEVISRSPVDGMGQPYPLLRMRRVQAQSARA